MKRKYLSADNEPALGQHSEGGPRPDPAEAIVEEKIRRKGGALSASQAEIDQVRDHVINEPALADTLRQSSDQGLRFDHWLEKRRKEETTLSVLPMTVAAGLVGGLFAVLTALVHGISSGYLYAFFAFLIVPMIEELGKQTGMIYLLERKPWKVIRVWQFLLVALIAALLFATIENLLYLHVYTTELSAHERARLGQWRWPVCTALHAGCSIIASLGLIRGWKKQLADGKPVSLAFLNFPFVCAVAIHGLYNLIVSQVVD